MGGLSYLMPTQIHLSKTTLSNLGADVELSYYSTTARLPGPRGGRGLLPGRHGFLVVIIDGRKIAGLRCSPKAYKIRGRCVSQSRSSCNRWMEAVASADGRGGRGEKGTEEDGDDYQPSGRR